MLVSNKTDKEQIILDPYTVHKKGEDEEEKRKGKRKQKPNIPQGRKT